MYNFLTAARESVVAESMAESVVIPTVDFSSFLAQNGDVGDGIKSAGAETIISNACSEYGFFQLVNHGIPLELMARALQLSREFFDLPVDQKLKASPPSLGPLVRFPAGYFWNPQPWADKNEHFLAFSPGSPLNIFPQDPPLFKEVLEEIFPHMKKLALLVEEIISRCLGLPESFLKEYNNDRSRDFLQANHYFPASDDDDTKTMIKSTGKSAHEDASCITFVFQDDVGGLEVLKKEGHWIPVTPANGTIVVNVGDVIQVLSNSRFKSATHRVVRPRGRRGRCSYSYFHNLEGEKWVEPLPQFTTDIGETPNYRGFFFKEYAALRIRNRTHPPSTPQQLFHITHFAQ